MHAADLKTHRNQQNSYSIVVQKVCLNNEKAKVEFSCIFNVAQRQGCDLVRGGLPQSEPRLRQEFTCPRSPCTWASWHCGGVTAETRARTPMSWRPCMNWTFELLSHAATYSQYDLASALDKSDENPPDGQYVPTSTRNGRKYR